METHFLLQKSNTILYCRHWTETARFYREIMALPVNFANDWFVEFQLTATSFLSIADAARATIKAVDGQGVTLAWQVGDAAAARAMLQARGIAVTPLQRKWGGLLFYCHDPEGHRLELWQAEQLA